MAGFHRPDLVRDINRAFSARNIAKTAKQLAYLPPEADWLDIFQALGVLAHVTTLDLADYRKVLKIPALNQRILTEVFRTSLFGKGGPTPLRFAIYSASKEGVEVTTTPRLIGVVLLRIDPPRHRTPRPKGL